VGRYITAYRLHCNLLCLGFKRGATRRPLPTPVILHPPRPCTDAATDPSSIRVSFLGVQQDSVATFTTLPLLASGFKPVVPRGSAVSPRRLQWGGIKNNCVTDTTAIDCSLVCGPARRSLLTPFALSSFLHRCCFRFFKDEILLLEIQLLGREPGFWSSPVPRRWFRGSGRWFNGFLLSRA